MKNFKLKWLLLSIILSVAGISQVWATDFTSGSKLYLKDYQNGGLGNSTWKTSTNNGKAFAYFFKDGGSSVWVEFANLVTGSWNNQYAVYSLTIPEGSYDKVIITRGQYGAWNDNEHTNNVWNQTVNLSNPGDGKNLLIIGSKIDSGSDKDKFNATWYTFSGYAYIEGRFNVQTAVGSGNWTKTFPTSGTWWSEDATNIPMTWDATNNRFYLHTYATMYDLTATQGGNNPYFFIKTSHTSGNISDSGGLDAIYQATSDVTFTNSNGTSSSKITLSGDVDDSGRANNKLRFNYSSGTNGYVVLYFTPADGKIWYDLEYQVNFGPGTGGSTVSATASSSLTTGDCVLGGTSVTFTHTAQTGYTWAEWNSAQNGSGTQRSSNQSYTVTISSSNTINGAYGIYSKYTENKSSITIAAGSNGSITSPSPNASPYSLGVATKQAITAAADDGYYFTRWTCSGTAAVDDATAASTNATTDGTSGSSGTVTANFAGRYVLRGSTKDNDSEYAGMPGWDVNESNMTTIGSTSTIDITLNPNTNLKYKIRDLTQDPGLHGQSYTNFQDMNSAWTLNGDKDVYITTLGYGVYRFSITQGTDPSVTVSPQFTSYQISMGYQTKSDGVASASPGDGGSVSAIDGDNFTIEDTYYVKSGGSVTFTATPNDGYQFIGWYSSSTTNGAEQDVEAISTENPYTVSSITEDKTVYALFKEILFDVTVRQDGTTSETMQVGTVSHPSITAVVPSGKVFDRWITTGSATVGSTSSSSTSLTGVSDNQSTVTAVFKDYPYIYYSVATPSSWSPQTMFVYFYSAEYWDKANGAGWTGAGHLQYYEMEPLNNEKTLWGYQYDPSALGGTPTRIAFMEDDQGTYANFAKTTGTYTQLANCMNMFVVTTENSTENKNGPSNTTYYYNTGYWSNYHETNSGYYLNKITGDGYSEEFTDMDGDGVYELSISLEQNHDYWFYVGSCNNPNWSNNNGTNAFTASSRTHTLTQYNDVSTTGLRCKITTTAGGYYTFKLTPSTAAAELSLTIDYPVTSGDYRVTYTHGGKKFPSNIIKTTDEDKTISLWLNSGDNTVKIEKCTAISPVTWTEQVSRTATTSKAGVYTMTLTCNDASSTISTPEAYTGNYYIRTDWAPGGWQDYKENRLIQNTLTYKEGDATTFDYYFCKWISKSGSDANVRFVVANEYNMAISDTLKTDDALDGQEYLPSGYPANVRFSWNSSTNTVKRAYLSGSTNKNDRFLVMIGDSKLFDKSGNAITNSGYSNLNANEAVFDDKNNWVYEVDLQAQSDASVYLVANYNEDDRDLYGDVSHKMLLINSSNTTTKYNIQVTYDFKTNNLMTAWRPGSTPITDTITGIPSVMLLRDHQNVADQITFGVNGSISGTTVYGVMQFNKYTLNNQRRSGGHATLPAEGEAARSQFERDLFWISFPFNVNMRDVFGFGEYGKHWIIEYYDGQGRADNGFWADSPSNWKFVTPAMRNNYVLEKGVGYILALDLDELGAGSSIWNNSVTDVYLYFPSNTAVTIDDGKAIINVPAHKCNIGPRFTNGDDRTIKDSHWNVIGVPSFANVGGIATTPETIEGESYPEGLGFYYQWRMSDNTLSVQAAGSETFKTMHAYMVQFTGTINWDTRTASVPSSVAARTQTTADRDYKLVLMRESEEEDHTLLRLTDDAAVTNRFEFNYDLCKEYNAGRGNIWTVTADTVEVAGNSMPKPVQTTVVPVGVKVVANGEYTFSMPEGTNGENVVLIDNAYGTRTNLGLMPYTVTLTAGTYEGRFALEFAPIQDSPTSLENDGLSRSDELNDANDDVRKVFVGGRLYIIHDGKVYDAAGQRVE